MDKQQILKAVNSFRGANREFSQEMGPIVEGILDLIDEGGGSSDAVKYTQQELTEEQQSQARTNIGGASAASVIAERDRASAAELEIMDALDGRNAETVTVLPEASASTVGKIYYVGPNSDGEYARYRGIESDGSYSFLPLGSTEMDLTDYATKAELSQLEAEVGEKIVKTFALTAGTYHPFTADTISIDVPANTPFTINFVQHGSVVTKATMRVYFSDSTYNETTYLFEGMAFARVDRIEAKDVTSIALLIDGPWITTSGDFSYSAAIGTRREIGEADVNGREATTYLDILKQAPRATGYINGSGVLSNNASFRNVYIPINAVPSGDLIVDGPVDFIHFYTAAKVWISCYASWSQNGITRILERDIPENAAYFVFCWNNTEAQEIYLWKEKDFVASGRLSPFFPTTRKGSARYQNTANHISVCRMTPRYSASAIKVILDLDPGSGNAFYVNLSCYNNPTTLGTLGLAPDRAVEQKYDGPIDFPFVETDKAFTITISKKNASGTLQTFVLSDVPANSVKLERIYNTNELQRISDNDAYIRNRDKDAMLAAAVRYNKVANDSMDFLALIVTDSHNDTVAEGNAVLMADGFQYVQTLLHLGDHCSDDATNFNATSYADMVGCSKPFYFVAGNHDVGNSNVISKCITQATFFTRYIQPLVDAGLLVNGEYTNGKGYYYHDFTDKKIRLVCVFEYDGPDDVDPNNPTKYTYKHGDSIISQTQAEWFCGVLDSVPSGYGIIVAMHNPFSPLANCVTTAKFNDPDWVDGYGAQRLFSTDIWADIIDAWVNKSANYTCTMVCTGAASYLNSDGKYYEFTHDFSARETTAKFICFLGGHVHRDCVWKHRNYGYQYQVTPICANTLYYAQCPNADIRRTRADGPSKDSLTAVGFDYDNQAIRLVKLGVNVTENMVARDYEIIKTQEP